MSADKWKRVRDLVNEAAQVADEAAREAPDNLADQVAGDLSELCDDVYRVCHKQEGKT